MKTHRNIERLVTKHVNGIRVHSSPMVTTSYRYPEGYARAWARARAEVAALSPEEQHMILDELIERVLALSDQVEGVIR
jgi:hypothetical protein